MAFLAMETALCARAVARQRLGYEMTSLGQTSGVGAAALSQEGSVAVPTQTVTIHAREMTSSVTMRGTRRQVK